MDKLVFTIPIYFRSVEKHHDILLRRRDKYTKDIEEIWKKINKPIPANEIEDSVTEFNRHQWVSWKYSLIVGYVEIRLFDGKLTASYYFVDAKRLGEKMRFKQFRRAGKLMDVSKRIKSKSNEEISRDIHKFLSSLPKLRNRFKSLYFDTEMVTNLLPAINWDNLINGN